MPTPRTCWPRTSEELRDLRAAGLQLLYLGLESGDDQTLADIHKGVTVAEQIAGCRRAKEAGLTLSVTAILGLAGAERSLAHAAATGEALYGHRPRVHRRPHAHARAGHGHARAGWPPAGCSCRTRSACCASCARSIAHTDVSDCLFRSNHASNYLPVGGRLPQDKAAMLATLDRVLAAPQEAQLRPESWRAL